MKGAGLSKKEKAEISEKMQNSCNSQEFFLSLRPKRLRSQAALTLATKKRKESIYVYVHS